MIRAAPASLLLLLAACVAPRPPAPAPAAPIAAKALPPLIDDIPVDRAIEQGGVAFGSLPAGYRLRLGGETVPLGPDGRFMLGFDRDAPATLTLEAVASDGRVVTRQLTVAPRDWRIERVDVPRRPGVTNEEFERLRAPEVARINAARAIASSSDGWWQRFAWPARGRISGVFGSQRIYRGGEPGAYHSGVDVAGVAGAPVTAPADGWRQRFAWPARGRISGVFGSQRIYRGGEPGAYHSGVDVAGGTGAPVTAPADGVVVLATEKPFTLEGNLLIIDHGMGLNSAFLHLSRIAVREGDRVRQGQLVGAIGSSGRTTGSHLHWALKWRAARIDPMALVGGETPEG